MQPYSHLPISAFALGPGDFPRSASPPLFSRDGIQPRHPLKSLAQHLAPDTALLETVALLELLRVESNFAGFIRDGGFLKARIKLGADGLEQRGRAILNEMGIEIKRAWSD